MTAIAGATAAGAATQGGVSAQEDGQGNGEQGDEQGGEQAGDEQEGSEGEGGGGDDAEGQGGEEGEGGEDGGGNEEVIVGPGGDLVFDPEQLTIAPGTTVLFTWDSDTHNVVPDSQPDEAEWEGHEPIEDTGFEYEHTFEVEGEYDYYCAPHVDAGMEGTIAVEEGGGGGGGAAAQQPALPDSAISLAVGTSVAMLSTLALAYFFIKYGGYEEEA